MPLPDGIVARFKLHYHCLNCEKNVFRDLDVPDVDEAPRDVGELLESAFFQRQRYVCSSCEGFIGKLVAVKKWRAEEIAV